MAIRASCVIGRDYELLLQIRLPRFSKDDVVRNVVPALESKQKNLIGRRRD